MSLFSTLGVGMRGLVASQMAINVNWTEYLQCRC